MVLYSADILPLPKPVPPQASPPSILQPNTKQERIIGYIWSKSKNKDLGGHCRETKVEVNR